MDFFYIPNRTAMNVGRPPPVDHPLPPRYRRVTPRRKVPALSAFTFPPPPPPRSRGPSTGSARLPADRARRHPENRWSEGRILDRTGSGIFSRAMGKRGWIGMTWPKEHGGHERARRWNVTWCWRKCSPPARPVGLPLDRRPPVRPPDPSRRHGRAEKDPARASPRAKPMSASA